MLHRPNGSLKIMLGTLRIYGSRRAISQWSQWAQLSQCYETLPKKMPLMLREDRERSIIRCGIIQTPQNREKTSTFLGALLADVYASDETWLHVLLNRQQSASASSPLMVKFGEQFDIQRNGSYTDFVIPSPFLKEHRVEFREVLPEEDKGGDGCHFYISLSEDDTSLADAWPTLTVRDINKIAPLPLANQVNSQIAVKGIMTFIRDKSSVKSYLEAMEESNFMDFTKNLGKKIDNREQIYSDLGLAVLENLKKEDISLVEGKQMITRKHKMVESIEKWRQSAHAELQSEVVPHIEKFLKKQLSVWKIYSYSDARLILRLRELVDDPLRDLKMVQSLYVLRGDLQIDDSSNPPLVDRQFLDKEVLSAYNTVNGMINENFLKLQLPLIICSTVGYVSGQFSLYSMSSLASLGIILGVRKVISGWDNSSREVLQNIYDAVRINIELQHDRMIEKLDSETSEKELDLERKQTLIHSISQSFKNL